MNAFRCNECGRIHHESELVTITGYAEDGSRLRDRFCPNYDCQGDAIVPAHIVTERRQSQRQVA